MATINGEENSTSLQSTASLIKLISWILLLAVVIGITAHAFFSNKNSRILDAVTILSALIILVLIVRYLSSISS